MLIRIFPTLVEVAGLFGDVPHEGHLPGLEKLFADEEVMAMFGGIRPPGAAKAFVQRQRAHWRDRAFGVWFFRDLETGEFAGWGGIRHGDAAGDDLVELRYALRPGFWGRGCATEISKLAVQLGFENLGLPEIVAVAHVKNNRAEAVMVRTGMRFDGRINRAGMPHVLYRINGYREQALSA
ncbi:acetyltransferase [Agaricicola taiwanensis]|uniref:Acetyltransferase n=1 Tax=Agaricicola taiwanensis TaxID=591372 RepID=A0A8J2VUM8_9RHOB|nr:GNAT family N-acetyltransferase [Agaricicola taiwanensis]GGE41693.1 acetyltransferase [Agaricicola taiwanensis]